MENIALIENAIVLEYTMAKLYSLYSVLFPEDKEFWNKMVLEENHHADIIKNWKISSQNGSLPEIMLYKNADTLKIEIKDITDLISQYKVKSPSMKEAYYKALDLELQAGELHYQLIMQINTDDEFVKIFQELNSDDEMHSKKIDDFIQQKKL